MDSGQWTVDSGQTNWRESNADKGVEPLDNILYMPEWTVGQIEMNLNGGNNMVSQLCLKFNH